MATNYIDDNIEALRGEFKLLDHWVYLNAGDQMIPGNYWNLPGSAAAYRESPPHLRSNTALAALIPVLDLLRGWP